MTKIIKITFFLLIIISFAVFIRVDELYKEPIRTGMLGIIAPLIFIFFGNLMMLMKKSITKKIGAFVFLTGAVIFIIGVSFIYLYSPIIN